MVWQPDARRDLPGRAEWCLRGNPQRTAPIPSWYRYGMSKQIAVRLPDDIVEFVDRQVSEGKATSRAVVVNKALERERRRVIAARDAAILAEAGDDPDMQSLAEHVASAPLELG